MKLGIIRCMQTEDYCPGSADFAALRERRGAFAGLSIFVSGLYYVIKADFISCGGCPGKKAVLRARELVRRGADVIAFASCIQKGTPIGFACPFAGEMKQAVSRAVGGDVLLLDHTH